MKRYIPLFLLLVMFSALYAQGRDVDASIYFKQGEELFLRNRPSEAAGFLEKAWAADSANITAALYLAMAYEQLGRIDSAIEVYGRILPIGGPRTALIAFNMGNVYYGKGASSLAGECYTKAIEADPGYAPAYLNRANSLIKTGALREAVPDYELYLALEPDSPKRPQIERLIALLENEIAEKQALPEIETVVETAEPDEAITETRAEMEKRRRLTRSAQDSR